MALPGSGENSLQVSSWIIPVTNSTYLAQMLQLVDNLSKNNSVKQNLVIKHYVDMAFEGQLLTKSFSGFKKSLFKFCSKIAKSTWNLPNVPDGFNTLFFYLLDYISLSGNSVRRPGKKLNFPTKCTVFFFFSSLTSELFPLSTCYEVLRKMQTHNMTWCF